MFDTLMGADPEIAFVGAQKKNVIPAGLVFKGVSPYFEFVDEVPGDPPKGAYLVCNKEQRMRLYADGMSNEFNMNPSADIQEMLGRFYELLQMSNHCADIYGCKLEILPFIPVTQADIDSGGVVCARFGCDPEETIYPDQFDPARVDARNHMARYFGAHIHSSMTDPMLDMGGLKWVKNNTSYILSAYDLVVGIANVLIAHGEDSRLRRNVYGRAGRHRIQTPYGWEYRTPDNYIMRSPVVLGAFFELSQAAAALATCTEKLDSAVYQVDPKRLFDVINLCQFEEAREIWDSVTLGLLNYVDVQPFTVGIITDIANSGGIQNTSFNNFYQEWNLDYV
jgi:hypothetical protein